METKDPSGIATDVDLAALFSDLVRLETELWERVGRRLRGDHDLPLAWFEPMQLMERVPECRVADIAQALSITMGGTSKIVDRIERAGWCVRRPNPDDARSSILALTRTGRRRLAAGRRSFEDELEACLAAAVAPQRLRSLALTVRDVRRHLIDEQEGT